MMKLLQLGCELSKKGSFGGREEFGRREGGYQSKGDDEFGAKCINYDETFERKEKIDL
jgi:hypothetical protein